MVPKMEGASEVRGEWESMALQPVNGMTKVQGIFASESSNGACMAK